MITPVTLANAIADAVALDDLAPPFMPGRIWEKLQGRDPDVILPTTPAGTADELPALPGGFRGEGEVVIDARPPIVWRMLLDPESLRAIIPGCETVEATGPDSYRARVRINVAGIGGTYEATMRLFDRHEPERIRLTGRAEGRLGFGEGQAAVSFTGLPDGRTRLAYRYVAAVGGKLAGFGQRMLDGVVRVMLASFFDRLGAHVRGTPVAGGIKERLRGYFAMLGLFLGRQ